MVWPGFIIWWLHSTVKKKSITIISYDTIFTQVNFISLLELISLLDLLSPITGIRGLTSCNQPQRCRHKFEKKNNSNNFRSVIIATFSGFSSSLLLIFQKKTRNIAGKLYTSFVRISWQNRSYLQWI